jgi:hypothetical protein
MKCADGECILAVPVVPCLVPQCAETPQHLSDTIASD